MPKKKIEMKIFVKFLNGKVIDVSVEPTDTIEIVKMKIEDKEGIPTKKQSLLLATGKLLTGGTISEGIFGLVPASKKPEPNQWPSFFLLKLKGRGIVIWSVFLGGKKIENIF